MPENGIYDLVVIGSGPGGEKGAAQAAYFGKSVALVERAHELGGASANTGTLPSKSLRETSLYLSGFLQRGLYGVSMHIDGAVTAQEFLFHQRHVAEAERERIATNLDRHHVDRYQGFARFVDPHTLEVVGDDGAIKRLHGHVILIATGSAPFRPPMFPWNDPRVHDSDTVLQLSSIPKSMLVAGGGVIGCEYACLFSALGLKVTLVEGRERLLSFLDYEVGDTLTASMQHMGIEVVLNDSIEAVEPAERLNVRLKSGRTEAFESLLAATGRSGNTAGMNLEAIGLKPSSRGQLEVNEHYQTAVPHIYAAGDVIGFPALASTSMEQARVAMSHAFDLKYKTALARVLPLGIYTIPECSQAGETEETLKKAGVDYVAGRARYSQNARGQIVGDKDGFLKLLFACDDLRLLGVAAIGEQSTELVHIGLAALMMGAGADLFIQICFNYPTLSETYKYATYDALGAQARNNAARELNSESDMTVTG